MAKKQNRKLKPVLLVLAAVIVLMFGWLLFSSSVGQSGTSQHRSEDLKISFEYPSGWHVDDRYQSILLTNYKTSQNRNDKPSTKQIQIQISNASLCQQSVEEDIVLGGCGEGQKVQNKILEKENKQILSGELLVFRVQFPDNSEKKVYYLQNGDRILQISKEPDPSQFEEEFEAIVRSITFQ